MTAADVPPTAVSREAEAYVASILAVFRDGAKHDGLLYARDNERLIGKRLAKLNAKEFRRIAQRGQIPAEAAS